MKIKYLMFIVVASFMVFACAEVKDDITTPAKVTVHPEGFGEVGSPNFHAKAFKTTEYNWNLKQCQTCHASNYSGGTAGVSCLTCHSAAEGPEACNTCHGEFGGTRISPPQALDDGIETTNKGVGAHVNHAYENEIAQNIGCYECHPAETGSSENYVYAHVGQPPADIQFGAFSNKVGSAEYDFTNNTCSNTYCHGNFVFLKDSAGSNSWAYTDSVIVGENFSPVWNKVDGTQAACGTCHMLPPKGHMNAGNDPAATSCSSCHVGVVDANGKIIDTQKHLNGKANVFGN